MANTYQGQIAVQSSMTVAIAPGANLSNYAVPVTPQQSTTYSTGTGPNQTQKIMQTSGSLAATTLAIDLTVLTNYPCVDGSTAAFAHVREILIFNDATTPLFSLAVDTIANQFTPWLTGTTPGEVIPAGSSVRHACPVETVGWVVDSTHKVIQLDSGAHTVPYRLVVIGD